MAKGLYPVIENKTRVLKSSYGVIEGTTRKIKKMYAVINGITKEIWGSFDLKINYAFSGIIFQYDEIDSFGFQSSPKKFIAKNSDNSLNGKPTSLINDAELKHICKSGVRCFDIGGSSYIYTWDASTNNYVKTCQDSSVRTHILNSIEYNTYAIEDEICDANGNTLIIPVSYSYENGSNTLIYIDFFVYDTSDNTYNYSHRIHNVLALLNTISATIAMTVVGDDALSTLIVYGTVYYSQSYRLYINNVYLKNSDGTYTEVLSNDNSNHGQVSCDGKYIAIRNGSSSADDYTLYYNNGSTLTSIGTLTTSFGLYNPNTSICRCGKNFYKLSPTGITLLGSFSYGYSIFDQTFDGNYLVNQSSSNQLNYSKCSRDTNGVITAITTDTVLIKGTNVTPIGAAIFTP